MLLLLVLAVMTKMIEFLRPLAYLLKIPAGIPNIVKPVITKTTFLITNINYA
jgi:hypothetical protein